MQEPSSTRLDKAPPIPQSIGPYKIESLLNKGGMSLLYLGIDEESRKLFVIKVLSPEYVNHREMVDHFLREAKIIALTDHPNIVKLYGQGQWESGLYIAMEFIQGISLRQFIMQKSLSLRRALEIVLQVAFALCHLHSHGVIHRDLTPENILIAEDGEVKVIDFGIAQLHEDNKGKTHLLDKRLMGTPGYMSPEQKENVFNASFASDLYALGIIAFELIVGKLSYGMIQLSLLPQGLQKIIGKAIAVSQAQRYQDVVDLITDLTGYLKSPEMEKEKPGGDLLKEVWEMTDQAQNSLLPLQLPNWPQLEIGLFKQKTFADSGLYYDFFKLPDNRLIFLLSLNFAGSMQGVLASTTLRAYVRSLMYEYLSNEKKPFIPASFIENCNKLLCQERTRMQSAFSLLVLDPFRDTLSLTCAGLEGLWHLPAGRQTPRKIISYNPLLGIDPSATFAESKDNWNEGDFIIMTTMEASTKISEHSFQEILSESTILSAQRGSEHLLKKLTPHWPANKLPKVVCTILRVM